MSEIAASLTLVLNVNDKPQSMRPTDGPRRPAPRPAARAPPSARLSQAQRPRDKRAQPSVRMEVRPHRFARPSVEGSAARGVSPRAEENLVLQDARGVVAMSPRRPGRLAPRSEVRAALPPPSWSVPDVYTGAAAFGIGSSSGGATYYAEVGDAAAGVCALCEPRGKERALLEHKRAPTRTLASNRLCATMPRALSMHIIRHCSLHTGR